MKIKKGDSVIVMAGKDKGAKGKVVKTFPALGKVVVEGVNMKKKHQRARRRGEQGSVIDIAHPIQASNVMIADGGKPSRVGTKMVGGEKVRIAKKSGKEI